MDAKLEREMFLKLCGYHPASTDSCLTLFYAIRRNANLRSELYFAMAEYWARSIDARLP